MGAGVDAGAIDSRVRRGPCKRGRSALELKYE